MPELPTDWAFDGIREHESGRSAYEWDGAQDPFSPGDDALLTGLVLEKNLISPVLLAEWQRELSALRRAGKNVSLGRFLSVRALIDASELLRWLEERRVRPGAPPILSSRYEIGESLGEGATAIVYRARDKDLQRDVALKVLRERALLSAVARERFRREARTTAQLAHPNLIAVHDAGESPNGQLYLILELVVGRPLSESLNQRRNDLEGFLKLLQKVARGVAAAHERGIVHRDLKPQNILVSPSGEPKVGDFGLAYLMDSPSALTRTNSTLGTPLYMAPEQVRGQAKEISPRTDVYALGVILYQALVGRPPHVSEVLSELYDKIVRESPIPPRRLNPKVPQNLEAIALKALEKDPGDRYSAAGEFADDLGRFLSGERVRARPMSWPERLRRRGARHRAIMAVALGGVILGIVAAVAITSRGGSDGSFRIPPERFQLELREVEGKVEKLLRAEQFVAATDLLEEARNRSQAPEWKSALERRILEIREIPAHLYPEVRESAVGAQARGALAEAQSLRARVVVWGRNDLLHDLDRALAEVIPHEPLPPAAQVLLRFPEWGVTGVRRTVEVKNGSITAVAVPGDMVKLGWEKGSGIFRVPEEGEVRVTFTTSSSTMLTVTFRIQETAERSTAYNFLLHQPVVGRPHVLKFPISQMRSWQDVPIRAGGTVSCVYVHQDGAGTHLSVHEMVVLQTKP